MQYTLDYIDSIIALPEELQSHITKVREAEGDSYALMNRVQGGIVDFMESLCTSPNSVNETNLEQLSHNLDATLFHTEVKAQTWLNAKLAMERYLQRIEEDARHIEEYYLYSHLSSGKLDRPLTAQEQGKRHISPSKAATIDAVLNMNSIDVIKGIKLQQQQQQQYQGQQRQGQQAYPPQYVQGYPNGLGPANYPTTTPASSSSEKKRKSQEKEKSTFYLPSPHSNGNVNGTNIGGGGSSGSGINIQTEKTKKPKQKKQKVDSGDDAYGGHRYEDYAMVPVGTGRSLPIYRGKSPCPPLCGPNPAGPDYIMTKGDYVAARTPTKSSTKTKDPEYQWILAVVVRHIPNRNRYEVEDVDVDEDENGATARRHYTLSGQHIIPLPKSLPDPTKKLEFKKDQSVLALYPNTTCFYEAQVIETPSARSRTYDYLVRFKDDDDEDKIVSQQYVLNMPRI